MNFYQIDKTTNPMQRYQDMVAGTSEINDGMLPVLLWHKIHNEPPSAVTTLMQQKATEPGKQVQYFRNKFNYIAVQEN